MKVLQVHNSYRSFGGEDVVVDGEAEILSRAGHEVSRFRVTNPDEGMAAGAIADKLFVERSIERALRHSLENFKAFVEEKVPILA